MKSICYFIAIFVFTCFPSLATVIDPITDYLNRAQTVVYGRSDRQFYVDDCVYRFDADINNDGRKETLVSSSLDQDGKQGNVFYVFQQSEGDFESVGHIYLSPNGFYLGKINEINGYGIVKFGTAGGGEGMYKAYVFDGEKIIEKQLGSIERNIKTLSLEGKGIEIAAKYSISVSDSIRDQVERIRVERGLIAPDISAFVLKAQIISSKELAEKYGINVESKTYLQALQDDLQGATQTMAAPGTIVAATPVQVAAKAISSATPTLAAETTTQSSSSFPIAAAIILAIVILGVVVFLLRRKST